jgi:kynurenine formamidase
MSLIWLSHVLDSGTPLYAGANDIRINSQKSIDKGDLCNTSILSLPSHSGTHVDAPFHFLPDGRRISDFAPEEWVFQCPKVINIPSILGQMIRPTDIQEDISEEDNIDLVLLKTGFERHRVKPIYWQNGPGISIEVAERLIESFPKMRAIGMDCISVSSLNDRNQGRRVHQLFLQTGLRIFEDMSLSSIGVRDKLFQVIALPLRFLPGDGAPCSIVGWIQEG